MQSKPVILVFVRYYLPGFRSGGPVRSLSNLIERLGDLYDFKVVCLDRDFLQEEGYPEVTCGQWQTCGKAQVLYLREDQLGWVRLKRLVREVPAQLVYLNSLLDPVFSIKPLVACGFGAGLPVLIAPRGELSPGALKLKWAKKRLFLLVSKIFRLQGRAYWHACSETEVADIARAVAPPKERVFHAANLVNFVQAGQIRTTEKASHHLRVVFLSRISPKKNLLGAIRMVAKLQGDVSFDVWGPIDDMRYWNECLGEIKRSRASVRIAYRGEVPHEQIADTLNGYDAFLLPTLGENFGHAILEALSCGLPVIISDRTPWRNLKEAGVGADISLDDEAAFVSALGAYAAMDGLAYGVVRGQCGEYARQWLGANEHPEDYKNMFDTAMSGNGAD
jgi:glycosyltransferase involved in cell wall biosynthesis